MSEDEVRRPTSAIDGPTSGSRGLHAGDIERAVASLIDAEPSADLRANVMRRIAAEAPGAPGRERGGRPMRGQRELAVAGFGALRYGAMAAAVLLVAVAIWLIVRPGYVPRVAGNRPPAGTNAGLDRPSSPEQGRLQETPRIARGNAAEGRLPRASTRYNTRRASAGARQAAGLSSASDQVAPAAADILSPDLMLPAPTVEDIAVAPLATPDPVQVEPLTVNRPPVEPLAVPLLKLDPIDTSGRAAGRR